MEFKSFRTVFFLSLIVFALFVFLPGSDAQFGSKNGLEVHFDDVPCVFCDYFVDLDELKQSYPNLRFAYGENDSEVVNGYENKSLYLDASSILGIPLENLGVHMNVVAKKIEINHTTDVNESVNWTVEKIKEGKYLNLSAVILPFFGEINVSSLSFAGHAVVLGFADGSNPCALWALVFLLGLIFCFCDFRKARLLVGIFLICSFFVYTVFMFGFLDVFSFTGYFRQMLIIVGVCSAYVGYYVIRASWFSGDRKHAHELDSHLSSANMHYLSIAGIVGFAFVISAVEFSCSSLITTLFTAILKSASLSSLSYLVYVLLYTFFYLLDDLIILCLALYVASLLGDRKSVRFGAGLLLLLLGILLLFFPNLLI